jgi:O-antigen/teichoic acid export membrane protein
MGAFYLTAEDLWKRETDIKSSGLIPVKPLIKESLPFFGNTIFALSIPRIIMILLGYIASAASLGIYSAASRFTGGIGLVSGALYNTYYPVMTGSKISPSEGFRLTARLAVYALSLGIIIAAVLFLLSDTLISLSFKIPEAASALKILSVTVIPILIYSVLQPYLISLHRESFIFKTYAVIFILNIPAALILIHLYGFYGAAYVSASAEILLCIILVFEFLRTKKKIHKG